jgi:MurNAc alpha-1-phosphate uridylyltransferase
MDALLMCVRPEPGMAHGDFAQAPDGTIRRGPGLIYGGAQIVKTDGLRDIDQPAFSLNLLWDRMLEDRRLDVLTYPGTWVDIGTAENLARAKTLDLPHV